MIINKKLSLTVKIIILPRLQILFNAIAFYLVNELLQLLMSI